MSADIQTDLERAAELESLRSVAMELQKVVLALLLREGRIRLSPSELASVTPGLSIRGRKDGAGALVLELVQPQAPAQPAIVVPQLRAH